MLRNWTIQKKLVAGITLLSLIFAFTAVSGITGLRRYRSLAIEVEQRADEILFAHDLNRCAEILRQSQSRMSRLENNIGMIESVFSPSEVDVERVAIENALVEMRLKLERYQQHIQEVAQSNQSSLLVDRDLQRDSLTEISAIVHLVDQYWHSPTYHRDLPLGDTLNKLVETTHDHFDLIHRGMAEFREDAHQKYVGWMWSWSAYTSLALGAVILLSWSFRTLVVKPFQTLLSGSRLVAGGQFGHRIDLGTNDELSELAEAMNAMSQRFMDAYAKERNLNRELEKKVRDRTRELIKNEQLASVGFLAAGVAHEINNPLAAIAFSAEELGDNVEDLSSLSPTPIEQEIYNNLHKNLRRIQDQAFRCKDITDRLLDFSRLGDSRRSETDLKTLVDELVAMVVKVGKFQCKTVRTHCEDDVFAHCNRQEIQQVVLNLVTNAMESVDTEGAVDVYVTHQDGCAAVIVQDNGCGMDQEVKEHLFEPFYTRRQDGTGTGLGLSISYRIVSQHHGSLIAESDGVGKGSRLVLLLPTEASSASLSENHESHWNHEPQKVA
ncbi:sensor histidine kinase [Stieleria varia]|uniref:histidine kinase n=1 Tax=Stieleria varia TaxID=2528005 RepID=A0A5C6AZW1_9BACT|nr:HAMP domain-containing sensor histidine kinase [Stieleria varia]TWU05503.1 C4-dicarboxylate transport sensor protein DctB [Stieleria varia]